MDSRRWTTSDVYKQQPGSIADVSLPDYSAGITCIPDPLPATTYHEYVASKIQQVLVLGGTDRTCNCSPLFSEANMEAYLPVWNRGFINPLQIYRVSRSHFRSRPHMSLVYPKLSAREYAEVQEFLQWLYQLGIEKWCVRLYWANVPLSELCQDRFVLKNRPVVEVQPGIYVPTTTRGGSYKVGGLNIMVWEKPGIVEKVLICLPRDFLQADHPVSLPRRTKEGIRRHLISNLPQLFRSPE